MSNELDLTNKKWIPENEIYLISISESIKENYPNVDIKEELNLFTFTIVPVEQGTILEISE